MSEPVPLREALQTFWAERNAMITAADPGARIRARSGSGARRRGRVMNEPDFPDGFKGAGPMFAAVPLGGPWYALAARGVTRYIHDPAASRAEAGFLDRGQAEAIADASTGGELSRYEGLCGWNHLTNARAGAGRQARTELEADR